jgi:hypothetical protein
LLPLITTANRRSSAYVVLATMVRLKPKTTRKERQAGGVRSSCE